MPDLVLIEVLKRATGYLQGHGSASPRLDAELLLAHSLGIRRLDVYLQFDRPLREAELAPYRALIGRRGEGVPVAYLTGRKEFMGLEFEVSADVLLPNPDTEALVRLAVDRARRQPPDSEPVADVGTGSGCIAVSIAHFVPGVRVVASDISPPAAEVARRNAERHGVSDRVDVVTGDMLQPLRGRRLSMVTANLPYIREGAPLPRDVVAQPALALYGGRDGHELVERLLVEAASLLAAGGAVLAEIDPPLVSRLSAVASSHYSNFRIHRDAGGQERVLEAWRD